MKKISFNPLLLIISMFIASPVWALRVDYSIETNPISAQEVNIDNNASLPLLNLHKEEDIDYRTGEVRLTARDVAIPLNGDLTVEVVRSFNKRNNDFGNTTPYGGWTIEVPTIRMNDKLGSLTDVCSSPNTGLGQSTFKSVQDTLEVIGAFRFAPERSYIPSDRNGVPETPNPSGSVIFTTKLSSKEVKQDRPWTGIELLIPGDAPRQFLFADSSNFGSAKYITNDLWRGQCVTQPSGEAFLVTSPRGVKYLFDVNDSTNSTIIETQKIKQNYVCYASDYDGAYDQTEYFTELVQNCEGCPLYPQTYWEVWELTTCHPNRTSAEFNIKPDKDIYDPRYWNVTSITDRFNNSIEYAYNQFQSGLKVPKTITANVNRDGSSNDNSLVLTFNYVGEQLKSISGNTTELVGYGYDSSGRLQSVSAAQQQAISFYTYVPGKDLIFTYENTFGGVVEYQYLPEGDDKKSRLKTRTVKERSGLPEKNLVWDFHYSEIVGVDSQTTITSGDTRYTLKFHHTGSASEIDKKLKYYALEGPPVKNELGVTFYTMYEARSYDYITLSKLFGDNNVENRPVSITKMVKPREISIKADLPIYVTSTSPAEYLTIYSYDPYGNPTRIQELGNYDAVSEWRNLRETKRQYSNDGARNIWGTLIREASGFTVEDVKKTYCVPSYLWSYYRLIGQPYCYPVWSGWKDEIVWILNPDGTYKSMTRYGVTTNYTYYGNGELATLTNAKQQNTRFFDYKRGIPQRIVDPVYTASATVSDFGQITSQTDGDQKTAYLEYEFQGINGSISGVGAPASKSTPRSDDHDIAYQVTRFDSVETRGDYQKTTTLNGKGLPINVREESVSTGEILSDISIEYDEFGREYFRSLPVAKSSSENLTLGIYSKYDPLGRIVLTGKRDDSSQEPECRYITGIPCNSTPCVYHGSVCLREAVQYFYTHNGHVVKRDNDGKDTYIHYNRFGSPFGGNKRQVTRPLNLVFDSDVLGRVTAVTEKNSLQKRIYNLASQKWVDSMTSPELGVVKYLTDAIGNVRTRISNYDGRLSGGSASTNYIYDNLNRLKGIDYQDPETIDISSIEYNASNAVTKIAKGNTVNEYAYNDNQRITEEYLSVDGIKFRLSRGYDSNDNPSSLTYPSGQVVEYTPNSKGMPTTAIPYVTDISYALDGCVDVKNCINPLQVKMLQYGNGNTVEMKYDQRGNVASIAYSGLNRRNQVLISDKVTNQYRYDSVGNLDNILVSRSDPQSELTNNVTDFGYDSNYQLVKANYISLANGTDSNTFEYDFMGNLLSKSGSLESGVLFYEPAANGGSNLLSNFERSSTLAGDVNLVDFNYDRNGNVIRYNDVLVGAENGSKNLVFDEANNLTAVRLDSDPDQLIVYGYDGRGLMVKKHLELNSVSGTADISGVQYSMFDSEKRLVINYIPSQNIYIERIYLGNKKIAERKFTQIDTQDSDGDIIPDKYEIEHQMQLLNRADASADNDTDGITNYQEYLNGTDPNDSFSY